MCSGAQSRSCHHQLGPTVTSSSSALVVWAWGSEWALRACVRGGIAKDLGCSAVPPACFHPVLDWEVQCEGRQLGLRHCGEFILKRCPHKQRGVSPAAPSCPNEPGWNSHLPKIQEYAKLPLPSSSSSQ